MSRNVSSFANPNKPHFGTLARTELDENSERRETYLRKLVGHAPLHLIKPEAAEVFNIQPYRAAELVQAGFNVMAAVNFVSDHFTIASYLAYKPGAVSLFRALTHEVVDHTLEHRLDLRWQVVVSYDFVTTIMIVLIGVMRGESSLKGWVAEVNSNSKTRALINALFPKALPPHLSYDHNSVYRIVAMFSAACYGDTRVDGKRPVSGMAAMRKFFTKLKTFQSTAAVDLLSYTPNHGFLKGESFQFQTPRFVVWGNDGQEMRATHLPENGSSRRNFIVVNMFDCTHMRSLNYRTKTQKNHEREAILDMLDDMIQAGYDLSNVVFVSDALNTTPEIVAAFVRAGAKFVLTIKANNGNKAIRKWIIERFASSDNTDIMTYISPIQLSHGREEKVTVRALACSNLNNQPELTNPEHLSINMADQLAKYPEVKTVVKVDKNAVFRRKSYSEEGLEQLNASLNAGNGHAKRHRVMISNIDLAEDDENFRKLLCVINESWLYEVAHRFTDENLKQDRLQMSNEERIFTRLGFNKIALDFVMFLREQLSKGRSNSKQKTSANDALAVIRDPINFLAFFCDFLKPIAQTQ